MVSVTSSRTAGPNRRRVSSRSSACSRSSSRSSSTSMSVLRVTRKTWCSTTSRPGKSSSRCAAMSSSSGRNAESARWSLTTTKRGTLLGTFTRAKRSTPGAGPCASRTSTARLSESPLMYGNGCAGSTASGVSTGKTWARKYSPSRSRSARSSSPQCSIRMPGLGQRRLHLVQPAARVPLHQFLAALGDPGQRLPRGQPVRGPHRDAPCPGGASARRPGPCRTRPGCWRRWRGTSAAPAAAAGGPRPARAPGR